MPCAVAVAASAGSPPGGDQVGVRPHLQHPQAAVPVVLPQRLVPLHVLVAAEDVVDQHVETAVFGSMRVDQLATAAGPRGQRRRAAPDPPAARIKSPVSSMVSGLSSSDGPTPGCCGRSHRRTTQPGPARRRSPGLRPGWRPPPGQRAERCSLPRSTQAVKHRGGSALPSTRHDLPLRRGRLRELRAGERGRLRVLPPLRCPAAEVGSTPRAAQDRHHPLLRRHRLYRSRRVERSGGVQVAAGPLLRADERHRGNARRHRREVHRRRRHGRVRDAGRARRRRSACVPVGPRNAGRSPRARRAGTYRDQHRRSRERHPGEPRDRRRRQRRSASRAGGAARRDPDRREDVRARRRHRRG